LAEVAYWFGDEQSSNPDKEILDAIRPTLATTSGPLVCIGSPYARKGEMYATHQRHFGPHGEISEDILGLERADRGLPGSFQAR
jgi:hypothetical protein